MDERLEDLRSAKNPKARIKILKGHFATSHSHINTYIDMSTVKSRHNNARETAKVLAAAYLSNTTVDTIVCMEETEVIGTFLAEQLADENQYSLSKGNNISIITPEMYQDGQILFSPYPWLGQAAYNTDANKAEGKGFMLAPIADECIFSYGCQVNGNGGNAGIMIGSKAEDPQRLADFIDWL